MRFICCIFTYVFSIAATAQLVVHLPQSLQGQVVLYGYYPNHINNQPLQQASLLQGRAVLSTQGIKPGIYSLYFTTNNNLEKASYIDILVVKEEQNFDLFWIPNSRWVEFINAPINQSYYEQKKIWLQYKEEEYYLQEVQQLYINSEYQPYFQQKAKVVENNLDILTENLLSNKLIWDDYLIEISKFKKLKKTYQHFWEYINITSVYLWSTPYKNEVLGEWLHLCMQQETLHQIQQEMFITGIVQHLGKNSELHPFLIDWLHQNYDYNRSNDFFVYGIKAMLALPTIDLDLKSVWKLKVQKLEQLNKGKAINLSVLENQGILSKKDTEISLVLYSEICGECLTILKQLNDLKNANRHIAVCVKEALLNESIINEKEYPNLKFFHPQDTSPFLSYVQRGTPSIIFLKKIDNNWQIESME